MSATIRPATEDDAAAIAAIYAPYVVETAISFETEAPSATAMRERIQTVSLSFPWLVCETAGGIAGYAYASPHRERAAYRWSVDAAVYVGKASQRAGIGRGLYTALFEILRLQGFYNVYAGITLPNPASVGLHEAVGFLPVGVYEDVGFKLGAWHDVGWWRLALRPAHDSPALPKRPSDISQTDWLAALKSGAQFVRL
jgi:phosphinothricin acetyltransferase